MLFCGCKHISKKVCNTQCRLTSFITLARKCLINIIYSINEREITIEYNTS